MVNVNPASCLPFINHVITIWNTLVHERSPIWRVKPPIPNWDAQETCSSLSVVAL